MNVCPIKVAGVRHRFAESSIQPVELSRMDHGIFLDVVLGDDLANWFHVPYWYTNRPSEIRFLALVCTNVTDVKF